MLALDVLYNFAGTGTVCKLNLKFHSPDGKAFLGSGPNRGWIPVECGEFLYVCLSPPQGHPARPEAQIARPEAQIARPESHPAKCLLAPLPKRLA